jgi:hypothetical protein
MMFRRLPENLFAKNVPMMMPTMMLTAISIGANLE